MEKYLLARLQAHLEMLGPEMSTESRHPTRCCTVRSTPVERHPVGTFQLGGGGKRCGFGIASQCPWNGTKGGKYKGLAEPVRLHVSGASNGASSSCLLHSLGVQPRELIDVVGLSVWHLESWAPHHLEIL